MKWCWPLTRRSSRPEPVPDAMATAQKRAADLEQRAEVAEQSLAAFLRRRDSWAGPVLETIHRQRGPHAR